MRFFPSKYLIFLAGFLVIGAFSNGIRAQDPGKHPDSSVVIREIILTGNKVTHDRIILRELPFAEGDTVQRNQLPGLMDNGRENLLNTSLFNFAEIGLLHDGREQVSVTIDVTERWYIWPRLLLDLGDRNFNVWWETRDLSRLSYGMAIDWFNFRGRRETMIASVMLGYEKVFSLDYQIPYIDRDQKLGLSFGAGFQGHHEVPYMSFHNKHLFFRDDEAYVRRDFSAHIQLHFRNNIYNSHDFSFRFDQIQISDSLLKLSSSYVPSGNLNTAFFSLSYRFKSDHRDYRPYPLEGYYFDAEAGRHGFNFIDKGNVSQNFVKVSFRQYWKISPKFYTATGLSGTFSGPGEQPFFLVRAVGYERDIVRGYEYYVIDGQNFTLWKNELKFALLPRTEKEIKFIRTEKFRRIYFAIYLNVFIDAGFAENRIDRESSVNDLQNTLLVGYGVGLDLVSYYDVVIRLEYSVNRLGEDGLFLHFRSPI